MKLFFLLIQMLLIVTANAQKTTTTYYDYNWQPCAISEARFVSTVDNTDSGWLRKDYFLATQQLQMAGLYKDSACKIKEGHVSYFYANGNLEAAGRMINNKRAGIYTRYHYNGVMADSGNYQNDEIVGRKLGWHPNGFMADSVDKKNDSITVEVSWFDNGNPSAYGYYLNKKKQGEWKYFHKNGNLACDEKNDRGNVVSRHFYDEGGKEQGDKFLADKDAVFKKGLPDWQEYVRQNTYWPSEYKITNSDRAVVVVSFTVNEDGKTEDIFVSTPFHQLMNKIAIEAISKSPAWKPRIDHNRRVKQRLRQPVTFQQETE
jgi:antitoxin component YwqK of YwqJK toxin-antitoxin module